MRMPRGSTLVAALLVAAVASRTSAQGLGEAAGRERQRRDALVRERGPARVLTDVDANPGGAWVGWRDWQPPDGTFTIRMPSRPAEERDEVDLDGGAQTLTRVYYHGRDERGGVYWVSVVEYPADYVRFQADRIRSGFPMSSLLPYTRNDVFVQSASHLGGYPVEVQYGTYSQVLGCLVGTRYYELLAMVGGGDRFEGRRLHPFFLGFRP
jgi:hypothetical protein